MATVSSVIKNINYKLRNEESEEFSDGELLSYVNESISVLKTVLARKGYLISRTGTGSFTTTEGTQSYDLTSVDTPISNLWLIDNIWISEYEPMDKCDEDNIYETRNEEEKGNTSHRCRPLDYCFIGNTVWFKQSPDATYTVNLNYYPNHTNLYTTDTMPYNDLFNRSIIAAVMMIAKNRLEMNSQLEIQLMALFDNSAQFLLDKRNYKEKRFTVNSKIYRRRI